jgi:hypothetical protein
MSAAGSGGSAMIKGLFRTIWTNYDPHFIPWRCTGRALRGEEKKKSRTLYIITHK